MNRNGHILLWLTITGCMLLWLLTHIRINTDLTEFLPVDDSISSEIINHQLNEGPGSRSLLLAVSGGSRDERAYASRELTHRLSESSRFNGINNGEMDLSDNEFKWVFSNRYLLSDRVEESMFSAPALRQALQQRLQELRSPLSVLIKERLSADPTSEYFYILQNWLENGRPSTYQGVWFSQDLLTAIIVAETNAPGWDVRQQGPVIDAIQQTFNDINHSGRLKLSIYGTGYYSIHSRQLIEKEALLFSLAASLALILIMLFFFRQPEFVILSAIPLLSAVIGGALVVQLFFSHIHGITLAFGITLLGITLDYPIHVFSHGLHLSRKFWATLYTGAITTIIAFAIFFFTDINGLAQLGLFTLSGLACAVVVSRWIIPLWANATFVSRKIRFKPFRWKPSLAARSGIFLLTVIFILTVFVAKRLEWEDNLSAFSPLPAHLTDRHGWLLEQLGKSENSRYLIAIHADSVETVLQQTEALTEQLQVFVDKKILQQFDPVTRYLPSQKKQRQRQHALPERNTLQPRLETALSGLPFKPNLFTPFLDEVEKTTQADLLSVSQYENTLIGNKTASLLYRLESRQWLSIIPLTGLDNPEEIGKLVRSQPGNNCLFLDLKNHTSQMVRSFRIQAGERVGISVLFMLTLLLVSIRSLNRLGRIILSLGISIMLTLSLLMVMDIPLSLFHFIALLLVAGIGLDYALFFSMKVGNDEEIISTLTAVSVCALSTTTVFGILAFSNIYVLRAIGLTTMLGVISAYLSTWFFSRPITSD